MPLPHVFDTVNPYTVAISAIGGEGRSWNCDGKLSEPQERWTLERLQDSFRAGRKPTLDASATAHILRNWGCRVLRAAKRSNDVLCADHPTLHSRLAHILYNYK
jgi:hypothetical protein